MLAATHRDLEARVRENLFREDLYYRLAIFPIAIPPLRQRREDIPELSEILLQRAAAELKLPRRRLSDDALRLLREYDFPGNVRELNNVVERACILAGTDEIGPDAFASLERTRDRSRAAGLDAQETWIESLPDNVDLRAVLSSLEKKLIERALASADGAQAEAARRLGLSRSDLSYKLGKYDSKAAAE